MYRLFEGLIIIRVLILESCGGVFPFVSGLVSFGKWHILFSIFYLWDSHMTYTHPRNMYHIITFM